MARYDVIDILKLMAVNKDSERWNNVLSDCFDTQDINRLSRLRYGIQAGMARAAKNNLNTEDVNNFFIRLNRSIENTAKAIVRKRHPMPSDNPLIAKDQSSAALEAKRKRDKELAAFFKRSSY